MLENDHKKWAREETLAAFNLYCRLPFEKVNSRNPIIIALAQKLGRTPASLSMKMGNLAHYDPKNPRGLKAASKLDKEIWRQFLEYPEEIIYESEQALAAFEDKALEVQAEVPDEIINLPDGEERRRLVRTRVNQNFFRRAVLSAYNEQCCITRLAAPALLNASHIIPWKENRERLNPRNGLCLNALHDRAFDRGLITVRPDGVILVSKHLQEKAKTCRESAFVIGCGGKEIYPPDKFSPTADFLDYHNRQVFVDSR